MTSDRLFDVCAAPGCTGLILPNAKGKRYCSDKCRAKGHKEAEFRQRLAHKVPEQTMQRRALRLAASWLGGRIA